MSKQIYSAMFLSFMLMAAEANAVGLPQFMSKVFSYSCRLNFIEGEGITNGGNAITCIPGQHLGQISADYEYYLFSTSSRSNFGQRGTSRFYDMPICGVNMLRYSCDNTEPRLEFGLSERVEYPFNVLINLSYSPEVAGSVGYAARLDRDGNCPEGLIKIRPSIAYPASINYPLPSNFRNENGRLNSMVVRTEYRSLEPFKIWRTPAAIPCDRFGHCDAPTGETYLMSQSPYVDVTPVVCAVPPSAM